MLKRLFLLCFLFFLVCPISVFCEVSARVNVNNLGKKVERIVSVDFAKAELRDILKSFSQQTGMNFVVSGKVSTPSISMFLSKVPVKEVLASLSNSYGLSFYKIPNTSIIKVEQNFFNEKDLRITKIFKLKYIRVVPMQLLPSENQGEADVITTVSNNGTVQGEDITFVDTSSSSSSMMGGTGSGTEEESVEEVTYEGIIEVISKLLSVNGRLTYDGRANLLIITDYPDRFPRIEDVIEAMDKKLDQILIKAELIEISDNLSKILGVNYGVSSDGTLLSATASFPTSSDVGFPFNNRADGAWTVPSGVDGKYVFGTLAASDFSVVLKALENSAKAKYLSRPRIYVMDGEAAIVDVTVDTAIATLSVSDGTANTTSSSYERANTGVLLKLTPFISGLKEYVSLFLEPSVTRAGSSTLFPGSVYDIYTRRMRTKVRVKNGDTVALGGLYQKTVQNNNGKIPILGDIPFIGSAFKMKSKLDSISELLVFITPYIINDDNVDTLHKKHTDKEFVKDEDTFNSLEALTNKKEINTKKEVVINKEKLKEELKKEKETVKLKEKTLSDKIKEYEQEVNRDAENVVAISNLGVAYAKAARYDDAISQFKKSILVDPSSGAAYNNLGNLYRIKKEYGAAISCLKRAVYLVPDHPYAYTTLGLCYEMKDMFDEARDSYKNALQYAPNVDWTNTARSRLSVLEGSI